MKEIKYNISVLKSNLKKISGKKHLSFSDKVSISSIKMTIKELDVELND